MLPQTNSRFSFTFSGYIWKMAADKAHRLLILELREEEIRKTTFAGIDLKLRKKIWEQDKLQEKWWIGLKEAGEVVVILNGFKGTQNPENKGIYILDRKNGDLIWENKDLSVIGSFKNSLLGKQSDENGEKYYVLDTLTGRVEKEVSEDEYLPLLSNTTTVDNHIFTGKHFPDDNTYFPKIASFIESLLGIAPVKTIEYLETEGKIIISFYSYDKEKLVNYLLVTNEEGEVLLHEMLAEAIQTIAFESYFVMDGALFFIKNRKELIIFEL